MRAIYEMAHVGIIWLGTSVARRTGDIVRLKSAGLREEYAWLEDEKVIVSLRILKPETGSREARCADLGFTHGKVMQLAKLAERYRAWWCRTWTIQEMVLPSRVYVCVGLQTMRWEQLVDACCDWESYGFENLSVMRDSKARLMKLDELRKRWQSTKYSLDILELLRLGRESYATDARDNVYGMLGLASPQDKQHIRVDYNCDIGQVYAEVTAMLINKYQSMDFITGSFWHTTKTSQPWLPSWVVDYGSGSYGHTSVPHLRAEVSLNWHTDEHGYKAGGETTPSVGNNEHVLKLHLEAVYLDRIVETLRSNEQLSQEYHPSYESGGYEVDYHIRPIPRWLQSWLPAAVGLFRSRSEREGPPSDPRNILQRSNDIVRDPTRAEVHPGDPQGEHHCSTIEDNDMLDDILLNIESLNDKVIRERLSSKYVEYECFMRRIRHKSRETLFATAHGFVGWAREDPRQTSFVAGSVPGQSVYKDDIIIVPRSASMPWVLRKTGVEGEYRLIIDCAVYGIMFGELMSLVESGQLQTQRYTLV